MKYRIELESSDAHAVEDPIGLIHFVHQTVRIKMPLLATEGHIILQDINGNKVGDAWLEIPEAEE